MAPTQHRKHQFAQETTDAFAEGWDAREAVIVAGRSAEPVNPYRVELHFIAAIRSKRSARQLEAMQRDAGLWDQGWKERGEVEELEKLGG